jgi:hypothetical protein
VTAVTAGDAAAPVGVNAQGPQGRHLGRTAVGAAGSRHDGFVETTAVRVTRSAIHSGHEEDAGADRRGVDGTVERPGRDRRGP